jgi:hypothetical protein
MKNAAIVVRAGFDFLFALKGKKTHFFKETARALNRRLSKADASTEDIHSPGDKTRRYLFLDNEPRSWGCVRTHLKVLSIRVTEGQAPRVEERYFVSSLDRNRLSNEQWLRVVRGHWAVENNGHHTWDTRFQEDNHPWVRGNAFAMVALMILRRIAYNIFALYRESTRERPKRPATWNDLIYFANLMMLRLSEEVVAGLRSRPRLAVTS